MARTTASSISKASSALFIILYCNTLGDVSLIIAKIVALYYKCEMECEPVSQENGPKEALERIRRIYKQQRKNLQVIPLNRAIPRSINLSLLDGTELEIGWADQHRSQPDGDPGHAYDVPAHFILARRAPWADNQVRVTGYRISEGENPLVQFRTEQGFQGLINPLETPARWQEFIDLIDQAETAL